ncbi:Aste57867_3342 [Aphanomyces stellatus]|uniref:Aste57867_3342 protein n=1 Tax=Aphanomyces stellatus TaxID=120398 RepID=A0A485KDB8_9STRA|nr:hypothetical protein As57867_003332 [Aphanomyces stellatus]VFT80511.1 Aste57867_3342 [Aphanomyces stellatus]
MSVASFGGGDSSYTYTNKSKKAKLAEAIEETSVVVATKTATASTLSRTAYDILDRINSLNLEDVASYFDKDDDDIDPYVVCDGVSVDAFNAYVGDGEGLRVALRFLDLSADGRILIVELPTTVHESTARNFEFAFLVASGNGHEVASRGSMTASRDALRKKEADATFGPKRSTPNRNPAPAPRTIADWVTLTVEVGRSQSWADLTRAAQWWCGYAGIQSILLLKVSATGIQIQYALYDIVALDTLPAQTTQGTFRRRTTPNPPAVNVTLDMRRILSIPAPLALPDEVNLFAVVNLRTVMDEVIDSI